uniref:Uncharacterized protein LOC113793503 n=1 Tax=Dermatophagoides pteronyssinus TaxID=6956 RepID=A0A6P6Y1G9_DERPT|nr:uncharacterized protein LOC113793503 [Dermatophagoides pteronyssinus]
MTQLLEEINTLTDSLQKNFKSLPENVDNNNNNTNNNDDQKSNEMTTTSTTTHASYNDEIQRRTIIKRKKIPVRSDLFNISFNNNDNANSLDDNVNTTNLILPSTLTSITDVLNSETDKPITSSGDSGVFLMASQKLVSDNDENVNRENLENKSKIDKIAATIKEEDESETKSKQIAIDEPPKLPPRKPSRSDVIPTGMDRVETYHERLEIEHLHNDTLSLQRSGYLWKTGPNYKSFKNRWCVLYRHSQNYFDANLSYYFNRSSMSASLSGKILLAEIEFISITETIPLKTRLPKIEKPNSNRRSSKSSIESINKNHISDNDDLANGGNHSLCFFEIGVKTRQGRIYLFAARSDTDRQQWIHAFVQATTLHAFKNKEIYHCGFVKAKFTITAEWQTCFALLTTDRFFYVFELSENGSTIPTLDCGKYHIFNLRKTVRLNKMDEKSSTNDENYGHINRKNSDSFRECCTIDCKFGFSLTQNGGHVVYLISSFESHINLWFRSIWRFWLVPQHPPEKLILEEQYLNKENVPIAFDKCLKFLDTFNQTGLNLFGPMQDSIHEPTVIMTQNSSLDEKPNQSNSRKRLPGHSATTPMLTDMDLWTQQNILHQLRFDSWNVHLLPQKYNACQISQLMMLYLRSMSECLFTETLIPYWIKLSKTLNRKDESDHSDSDSINSKTEQIKRLLKFLPPVNYALLRRFIIYLANTTHNNEEYSLSTSLCKTLFFSKPNKTPISVSIARSILIALIQNHVWLFDVTKEELEKELHIKRVVNLIISQNRKQSAKKQSGQKLKMNRVNNAGGGEHMIAMANKGYHVDDRTKVNSLIIGIKVSTWPDNKQTNVNVHINRSTTASEVFEMILEKNATPIKCQTIVADQDEAAALVVSSGSSANPSGSIKSVGSTNAIRRHQQPQSSTIVNVGGDGHQIPLSTVSNKLPECQITNTTSIPALTFIERHRIKSRQSHERRNFGQTLVFNSWIELDQWIKGLLEASSHRELFEI